MLLDENLPRQLKPLFPTEFTVFTVRELGWQSKKNGELLAAMTERGIGILFTADRNLQFQQSLDKFPIQLVVLLTLDTRRKLLVLKMPIIVQKLKELQPTDKIFDIDIRD